MRTEKMPTKRCSHRDFSKALSAGELVFFGGSGISYDSGAPSAMDIMQRTSNCVLTRSLLTDLIQEISKIQPEVFYETLLSISDNSDDALTIWSALSKDTQKSFGYVSTPNPVHTAIVQNAAEFGNPIFTTNFDTLFEDAANDQKITVKPYLPNPDIGVYDDTELKLIKLHGSIHEPGSMLLTMSNITRRNTFWLEYLEYMTKGKTLCIVGYSGRDLDIFPTIAALGTDPRFPRRIIWINEFTGDYSDLASINCGAERLEAMYPAEAFSRIATGPIRKVVSKKVLCLNMLNDLEAKLNSLLHFNQDQRLLMTGMTLEKIGRHEQASRFLEDLAARMPKSLTERQVTELLLRAGTSRHERAKYEDGVAAWRKAIKYATSAKRSLGRELATSTRIQALSGLTEAIVMQAPVNAYFDSLCPPRHVRRLIIYSHIFLVLVRLVVEVFFNRRELDVRGQNAVLATRLLFLATVQERVLPLLGQISSKIGTNLKLHLGREYNKLIERCYEKGHSSGVADSHKFLVRLGVNPGRSHVQQILIQGMITDRTGLGLAKRNEADDAIAKGDLGSGLILYNQKMTMAAMAIADMKTSAHLS
jgi:SIR2-like domain